MKKRRTNLAVSGVFLNTGQLEWLPTNPRTWTQTDIDRTAKSITEDPDFLEDRPVLVVPFTDGNFIVFAGNLRHEGSVAAGRDFIPAVVYTPESDDDRETIKRRAMKDNGSFGAWDYDALANEWDDLPLVDWGVPAWKKEGPEQFGEDFSLPTNDAPASNQITFYFAAEQKEFVESILKEAEEGEENFGNENANGNKLYQIVKEWAALRT